LAGSTVTMNPIMVYKFSFKEKQIKTGNGYLTPTDKDKNMIGLWTEALQSVLIERIFVSNQRKYKKFL